jgi:ribonuclease HI
MVRQLNGDYRIRDSALKVLHEHVLSAAEKFHNVTFEHVPRTNARIARADRLVNQVLDDSQ